MLQVDLTDDPIDVSHMLSRVASKRAGAAVLFTGTTRQETDGLTTDWLEYDAYRPLARRELARLYEQAVRRFQIVKCSIVHRLGKVSVGEVSVAIAVSAVHRAEAFASASWLMGRIKADVPIWKRQVNDSEAFWVHPENSDMLARNSGRCSQEPFDELP